MSESQFAQLARDLGVPLIEMPSDQYRTPMSYDTIAVCGQCGREIKRVESYYCGSYNCPVQLRVKRSLQL